MEVGLRMVDRDPPDVDGAVAFLTDVFLAAFDRLRWVGNGRPVPKLCRD